MLPNLAAERHRIPTHTNIDVSIQIRPDAYKVLDGGIFDTKRKRELPDDVQEQLCGVGTGLMYVEICPVKAKHDARQKDRMGINVEDDS